MAGREPDEAQDGGRHEPLSGFVDEHRDEQSKDAKEETTSATRGDRILNYTEANEILTELKAFFPDWTTWVRALDNRDATLRVWIKSLMTQDKHHVLEVIDEYTSGKRKAPTSFEYERLIFAIVAAAREIRSSEFTKETQRETIKTWRDEQEEVKRRRSEYKPMQDRSMKIAAAQFAMNVEAVVTQSGRPRSQWTQADQSMYDEMAKEVIESFREREVMK